MRKASLASEGVLERRRTSLTRCVLCSAARACPHTGNSIGSASVWNVDTQAEVKLLGHHRDKVLARFHPSRAVLCTAAHDLACWLPSSSDDEPAEDVDMLTPGMSAYESSTSRRGR